MPLILTISVIAIIVAVACFIFLSLKVRSWTWKDSLLIAVVIIQIIGLLLFVRERNARNEAREARKMLREAIEQPQPTPSTNYSLPRAITESDRRREDQAALDEKLLSDSADNCASVAAHFVKELASNIRDLAKQNGDQVVTTKDFTGLKPISILALTGNSNWCFSLTFAVDTRLSMATISCPNAPVSVQIKNPVSHGRTFCTLKWGEKLRTLEEIPDGGFSDDHKTNVARMAEWLIVTLNDYHPITNVGTRLILEGDSIKQ